MTETFREQLSRVKQMIEDDGETWDLSDNDKAALKALLKEYRSLLSSWREQDQALQDIFGACGTDTQPSIPDDIAKLAVAIIASSPTGPAETPHEKEPTRLHDQK